MGRVVKRAVAAGAGCLAAVMLMAGAQAWAETGSNDSTTSTTAVHTVASLAIMPAGDFQDVIGSLSTNGVIAAAEDPTIDPGSIATREQLAVYLARALKLPASPALDFGDVGAAYWGYSEIGAIVKAGVMKGTSATRFSPFAPVSRQEAAATTLAAMRFAAAQNGAEEPDTLSSYDADEWLAGFQDRSFVDPQYWSSVASALSLGLFEMPTGGWLLPKLALTYQELAGLVDRSLVDPVQAPSVTPAGIATVAAVDAYPKLAKGSKSDLVLLLQQRLNAMSYVCGTPDGKYSNQTRDAVYAFEKYERLKRTGVMDQAAWDALWTAAPPVPVYGGDLGKRVEVDLTRQVMMLIRDNQVFMTIHVSTGKYGTPTGDWRIRTRGHGWHMCSLGPIYAPAYFMPRNAIHGYPSVPTYPASHGCVRTPIWIQDEIVDELVMDELVHVFNNKLPAATTAKTAK